MAESKKWLNKKEAIKDVSDLTKMRHQSVVFYHSAETALQEHNYKNAEEAYRKALELAELTDWKKQAVYIKGGLAVLYLEQSRLEDSRKLSVRSFRSFSTIQRQSDVLQKPVST